jgi:hypothetical protein
MGRHSIRWHSTNLELSKDGLWPADFRSLWVIFRNPGHDRTIRKDQIALFVSGVSLLYFMFPPDISFELKKVAYVAFKGVANPL